MTLVSHVPVQFRLVSNANLFSIDRNGEVTLTNQIDREKSAHYLIGVLAYTESSPPLTAMSELSVQIVDYNDNVPQFENDVYSIYIAENMPAGTSLLKGKSEIMPLKEWGTGHYFVNAIILLEKMQFWEKIAFKSVN